MREVDMGNDRELFSSEDSGLPVYEGRWSAFSITERRDIAPAGVEPLNALVARILQTAPIRRKTEISDIQVRCHQIPLSSPVTLNSTAAAVAKPGSKLRRRVFRISPLSSSLLHSEA
jgi:hypothetical protein